MKRPTLTTNKKSGEKDKTTDKKPKKRKNGKKKFPLWLIIAAVVGVIVVATLLGAEPAVDEEVEPTPTAIPDPPLLEFLLGATTPASGEMWSDGSLNYAVIEGRDAWARSILNVAKEVGSQTSPFINERAFVLNRPTGRTLLILLVSRDEFCTLVYSCPPDTDIPEEMTLIVEGASSTTTLYLYNLLAIMEQQ